MLSPEFLSPEFPKSSYARRYGPEYYMARRAVLCGHVGTSDFLWCISATRSFPYYEKQKPIEWCIDMEPSRVFGYVREDLWSEFLSGREMEANEFFSRTSRWADEDVSVLVAYPVRHDELISRTVFDIRDVDDATIIRQEVFQDSFLAN